MGSRRQSTLMRGGIEERPLSSPPDTADGFIIKRESNCNGERWNQASGRNQPTFLSDSSSSGSSHSSKKSEIVSFKSLCALFCTR
jgi:hypothetical protein